MPTISVIVPVYNTEQYLSRCVDSILAQTFTDFELILVNDGSNDGSGAICDEYAEKDPRVNVIHQENRGVSPARNMGLDHASGEYLYFVDSDDYIDPALLETVIPYMENNSDLVAFGYSFFNESGVYKTVSWKWNEWRLSSENRISFYVESLLRYKLGWEACFRMFRRDLIEQHNIRFEGIIAEDLYFSLCYCAYAKKIVCIEKSLYYYFQHNESTMARERTILNAGRMNELGKSLLKYFKNESVEPCLIRAFPVIFYFIMENVLSRYTKSHTLSYGEFRSLLMSDIQDFGFYSSQMKKLRRNRKWLRKLYSPFITEMRIDIAEYYADGNVLLFKVKCKLNTYTGRIRRIIGRLLWPR